MPQGSSLSPILYIFYNADFIERYIKLTLDITASSFIDDAAIMAVGNTAEDNLHTLNAVHDLCTEWSRIHGSPFAVAKYELVHDRLLKPRPNPPN